MICERSVKGMLNDFVKSIPAAEYQDFIKAGKRYFENYFHKHHNDYYYNEDSGQRLHDNDKREKTHFRER